VSPWTLSRRPPVSPSVRRYSRIAGTAVLAGTILSLFVWPVSFPLVLIYSALGLLCGFLGSERLDELGILLSLALMEIGTRPLTNVLIRNAPHWHTTSWQPPLIAGAAFALAYFAHSLVTRRRTDAG